MADLQQPIDVQQIIAAAQADRAAADAKQKELDAANAAAQSSTKANQKVKEKANQKLFYANSLKTTIDDYEGRLRVFAEQIARDGKLDPVNQKEFNRIVKDYQKVTNTFNKTIQEADAILAAAPSPTQVTTRAGKVEVAPTAEEKKAADLQGGTKEAPKVDLIATANNQLNTLKKDAKKFVYGMSDAERLNLSNLLNNAGYVTPKTGTYNPSLVANYAALLNEAVTYNNLGKDIPGFTPKNYSDFLAYKIGLTKLGGTRQPESYTSTEIFSDTDAANYIQGTIRRFLGRDATAKEISSLTAKLKAEQKAKPDRVTTDANGNRIVTRGVNAQGFLEAEIQKLPEYQKKELGKATADAEKIVATARANGIAYDQNQLNTWANRVKNGEDVSAIQNEIRNMASHGRPEAIAKQLQAGNDLATILSPYKTYMQQILEIPADQIDINDKTLQSAIIGDKPMSLYEYQNALRKDPRWQYTNNAKTAVSDSVQKILQDFGFMG